MAQMWPAARQNATPQSSLYPAPMGAVPLSCANPEDSCLMRFFKFSSRFPSRVRSRAPRGVCTAGLALIAWAIEAGCSRAPKKTALEPRVYVSAEESGVIAVVDPVSAQILATIPVGKRPRGVKVSRDGKFLYVALSGSPRSGPGVDESTLPPADRSADGIGVVDLATRKLLRTLPSGQDPESFDLSPDGKTV